MAAICYASLLQAQKAATVTVPTYAVVSPATSPKKHPDKPGKNRPASVPETSALLILAGELAALAVFLPKLRRART